MAVQLSDLDNRSVARAEGAVLFDDGRHRWVWLGADTGASDGVAANQYLIQDGGRGCLLDPGSVLDFARTVANLSRFAKPEEIDYLFFTHQDPDVSSAMPMWGGITKARMVISTIWGRFMPHYGEIDQKRIELIPDKGGSFRLGSSNLQVVPAHYLHSVGNITLYDPVSKFLFTGDIGAAVMPAGEEYLLVDDFDKHLKFMDGFHKRYMNSGSACRNYVERVSKLPIEAVVPQHGAIFAGANAKRFLDWFASLKCGVDLIDQMYR